MEGSSSTSMMYNSASHSHREDGPRGGIGGNHHREGQDQSLRQVSLPGNSASLNA